MDLSGADTSGVTNMYCLFISCDILTENDLGFQEKRLVVSVITDEGVGAPLFYRFISALFQA